VFNFQLFVSDEEVDVDAIVAEVGLDWRAAFEKLAAKLDQVYAANDPLLAFRMTVFGEDADLDGYARVLGRDWRAMLEQIAPLLDCAFAPYAADLSGAESQVEPARS
jgi:hypothetical protein